MKKTKIISYRNTFFLTSAEKKYISLDTKRINKVNKKISTNPRFGTFRNFVKKYIFPDNRSMY